ncbi:hypothetical protein V8G54_021877, partial [Vigna mungo]
PLKSQTLGEHSRITSPPLPPLPPTSNRHQLSIVISCIAHHPHFLNCGLQLILQLHYYSFVEGLYYLIPTTTAVALERNFCNHNATKSANQNLGYTYNKETYTPSGLP